MKKKFLGIEISKTPHKIARELVNYMLEEKRPISIEHLTAKLSESNTLSNLKTRIKRCLTNTPDIVNEKASEQSRIFSIPLHYKNIDIIKDGDKFSLELTSGTSPIVRDTDYTDDDLQNYLKTKKVINQDYIINIKNEFAKWLKSNAPESYFNQYLGDSVHSIIERLNEIQEFFPERDLFLLDKKNPDDLISYIKIKISREDRQKNKAFESYDIKNRSGIPKAVLGKKNYLKFINENYNKSKPLHKIKILLANITWNSKNWKEINEDASGHGWVNGNNIPHESWNFDFDNPRNINDKIYGFAKFTNVPKIEGNNNLIIFYSKGKIVGFYGKAEILKDWVQVNDVESYNLIGKKEFSLVLENKIDDIKDKGYLEDKARVGQVGYMYLNNIQTSLNILDEAILLNPTQSLQLNKIKNWIKENQEKEINTTQNTTDMKKEIPLNQILFGPPGTGKTYHTINKAIEIADAEFYTIHKNNREELKKRFKLLLLNESNNGQIGFSTFHQSFSYEDFVEGIKPIEPKEEDTFLQYKIQEGIFKKICRLAKDSLKSVEVESEQMISLPDEEFDRASFYKISLGNSQYESDQEIFDYCAENNCITIGFGDGYDLTNKDERELKKFGRNKSFTPHAISCLNIFKNYIKNGSYVVVSNGNNYVRAIGKVVGDYEYQEESPFTNNSTYNHFRKVEWIFNDKEISSNDIYDSNLHQKTVYKLNKLKVKKDFFVNENKIDVLKLPRNPKNFVLIVDEINRGNISSIFGELITLIEKDKRAGGNEELSVILPYSKEEFKVPSNVFIVGTMNTADRSIEALDTALRRRFTFQEMPPIPSLITTKSLLKETDGKIDDVDLAKLLETINNRIEKLIDKDHKIGHSYFMKVVNKADLISVFKDKVIPLLEEYFFGDFGKIGLILGSSFISKVPRETVDFADFEYDDSLKNDLMERILYKIEPEGKWDFENIYKSSNSL